MIKISAYKSSLVVGIRSLPGTPHSPPFVFGAALSVCSPLHCSEKEKDVEGLVVLPEFGGPGPHTGLSMSGAWGGSLGPLRGALGWLPRTE